MTVSSLTTKVPYACDGTTVIFPITFDFFEDADIRVVLKNDTTKAETVLVLNTDFTIPAVGEEYYGNIILAGDYAVTPPVTGYTLLIKRVLPLTQLLDYIEATSFPAATHEEALDRRTMIEQQLAEMLTRTLLLGEASTLADLVLPEGADKYIKWNLLGTALEAVYGTPPISTWLHGTGVPSDSLGINGDFYIHTATSDIYYKSSGTWGAPIANIMGPEGDPAPEMAIQYSNNGSTNWHDTYAAGDKYCRFSTDDGATWSDAMKFIGDVGEGTGDMLKSVYDSNDDGVINVAQLDPTLIVNTQLPNRNAIINGCCMVNQRVTPYTLVKDTYCWDDSNLYGPDRFEGMATGTAVNAGTFGQTTTANCGVSGYAFQFAGVTLTGTGIIYFRHRMEAKDAVRFKNQTASFRCQVYQDTGGAINYTIYVRKANAADNFAAVTAISNSGAIAVPNATATSLPYLAIAMGDCSNGIEIEIKVECGAITTKNFEFTEVQLEPGSVATSFEFRQYGDELRLCQRRCIVWSAALAEHTPFANLYYYNATILLALLSYPTEMAGLPSFTFSADETFVTGNSQSLTGIAVNQNGVKAALLQGTVAGQTAGYATLLGSASTAAFIIAAIEL